MEVKPMHKIKITFRNGKIIHRKRRGVAQHLFIDTYREFEAGAKKISVVVQPL